jgi:molybdate transport system ATP-binding protein
MIEIAIRKRLGGFELGVELLAAENQIIVLFGPSGAGKSMTLASVAGLVLPDSGRIVVGKRVLFDSSMGISLTPQHRNIGLVKQNLALFPHLTVEQNVAYGLSRAPRSERSERSHELLRSMHLDSMADRYPSQLSGGQQQRVALARALAPDPGLLLLDEPFSALDAPTRMQLREELLRLQRQIKIPILFVTHDLGEAYFLADRLAVIDAGKILQIDVPGEVLSHPCCLAVARAVGVKNIFPGTIESCDHAGCRVRVADMILNTLPGPFEPGMRVHVCLRPERVMLLRPERAGRSSDENAVEGEVVREMNDGMMATLFFRAIGKRLSPDAARDYDLQIELPVYIFERLRLAQQREWTVSLRKNAIHLIR